MASNTVDDTLKFCLSQLQLETSNDQLTAALQNLLKIYRNIQRCPSEEKYRTLRTENKTFQDRVWQFTNAQQFLIATGWTKVDGSVFLLEDQYIDTAIKVLEQIFREVSKRDNGSSASQVSSRSSSYMEKERQLKELRQRQYEAAKREKEEKKRIADMIKSDRRETDTREMKDSHAKPRNFGSKVKRFEDIGVDLNKGGG